MTTNPKETLLDWLRDAHAMEKALVGMLDKQAKRAEGHPAMKQKLEEHRDVTKMQMERLETVIKKMGGDTSTLKDLSYSIAGHVHNMVPASSPDGIVKIALANHGIENFEIACYKSLVAAAESMGETEVARVCRELLDQETEMANYLSHHIPHLTNEYLQKTAIKK
ncbi:MAG TPA: ferritin-like domain-containing protein [Candidatus Thermoplasmatota archaeon]|nr:ferritin-like domain-containing protein [Candidatus Thermoplasmatota archaeon]